MKLLIGFLVLSIVNVLSLEAQVPDSTKYKLLEPYDFHLQWLRSDPAIMIDVREPFEYKRKMIRDAINIPSSGNLEKAADTLNRGYTYFLYCTTDFRSISMAEKLFEKGFRKLVVLKGGITAWRKENMPLKKGKSKRKKV